MTAEHLPDRRRRHEAVDEPVTLLPAEHRASGVEDPGLVAIRRAQDRRLGQRRVTVRPLVRDEDLGQITPSQCPVDPPGASGADREVFEERCDGAGPLRVTGTSEPVVVVEHVDHRIRRVHRLEVRIGTIEAVLRTKLLQRDGVLHRVVAPRHVDAVGVPGLVHVVAETHDQIDVGRGIVRQRRQIGVSSEVAVRPSLAAEGGDSHPVHRSDRRRTRPSERRHDPVVGEPVPVRRPRFETRRLDRHAVIARPGRRHRSVPDGPGAEIGGRRDLHPDRNARSAVPFRMCSCPQQHRVGCRIARPDSPRERTDTLEREPGLRRVGHGRTGCAAGGDGRSRCRGRADQEVSPFHSRRVAIGAERW